MTKTVRSVFFVVSLAILSLGSTLAWADDTQKQHITLDGDKVPVFFNDGDSFRVVGRHPRPDFKARIGQFNTLESYGPVHRWGEWSARELYKIAKKATDVARSGEWTCESRKKDDGTQITDSYGRVLVNCPDLAEALVRQGLAHAFFVDPAESVPKLLEVQAEAKREKRGMWAKGAPDTIMTSVHSADENKDSSSWKAYNRVVDTNTGLTQKVEHTRNFGSCEEVCEGPSCLTYVPFQNRYGDRRAECLR